MDICLKPDRIRSNWIGYWRYYDTYWMEVIDFGLPKTMIIKLYERDWDCYPEAWNPRVNLGALGWNARDEPNGNSWFWACVIEWGVFEVLITFWVVWVNK